MGIAKFVVRRLLLGVLTLFIVSVVVFALTQALGDPVRAILGREAQPESVLAKREELGLTRPVLTQYWSWLTGLVTGDPGTSFTNGVPVLDVLGDRIWNSLFLMAISAAVSIPISIAVGTYAAARRDKPFDSASSAGSLVLASMPEFVTGLLLIVLLATNVWQVFPAVVRIRPGEPPWVQPSALVLPVLTLTLGVIPYVSRVMRASMIEVLESDYIVVENIFNFPGIGLALRDAVTDVNVPVVQFIAMLIAAIYVIVNLLADVGTILVTPRLRTGLR